MQNLEIPTEQEVNRVRSENEQVLNFITNWQGKHKYNPRCLDEYNALFNAELSHFLNVGNFLQETVDLFMPTLPHIKAPDRDLKEVQNLMYRIATEINNFRHVSEYVPEYLTKQINSFKESVNDEMNKRENQF
jgi:hypothetical protein